MSSDKYKDITSINQSPRYISDNILQIEVINQGKLLWGFYIYKEKVMITSFQNKDDKINGLDFYEDSAKEIIEKVHLLNHCNAKLYNLGNNNNETYLFITDLYKMQNIFNVRYNYDNLKKENIDLKITNFFNDI